MTVANRPRLGRGLKSLIGSAALEPVIVSAADVAPPPAPVPAGPETLRKIPLNHIAPNPNQPRQSMDAIALAELVASIKAHGILQPIVVRAVGGDRYELIAGHRRAEAAKIAGLREITAVVRSDSTEEKQAEWALIENIHRADLNAIERAKAYKAYVSKFHLTHAQAAEKLGEDRTTITNFLRLLDLNPGVQDLIARGILSAGHAKVLAGVADPARQDALANRCVTDNLSVRKLEDLIVEAPAGAAGEIAVAAHARVAKSAHILDLEQSLSRKLGTKMRIVPSKKKNSGKIIIQYFSLDEFDRIVACFEHATRKDGAPSPD